MNEPAALATGQAQDLAALSDVLEQHRPALMAFIERRLGAALRGKVEPQDIAQEVVVKALRLAPTNVEDWFRWLCHLAEHCIVDEHRRFTAGKRATDRERSGNALSEEDGQELVALLSASMTTPSQAVVRNERQRQLDEALATLPDDQRELLRLRYGEGLATRDIAIRLNKTDGAVRVLLTRIVQRLRDLLAPR
jgi:RNA polymerase sigma-70 factor (ECF subfamily)